MAIILITGARAPIALELSRSFHKAGHIVIMADSMHLTIARWSNTVKKYYLLPSPRYELPQYIERLNEIIEKEQVEHLIPTCEEAYYMSMGKEQLKAKVWTSAMDLINRLHNKYLFSQFTKEDLPIPKTCTLTDFSDWENAENYVFKPIYSRFATSVIIGKKLSATYFSPQEKTHWIAQKRIKGKEICVYSIWDNGKLKAYAAYHPLYRAGKGSGIFFEPVFHSPTYKLVQDFGAKMDYTGQLCFDVIIDETNTPYFIECNPRGTSGAHLIHSHLAQAFLGEKEILFHEKQTFSIKYALFILHFFSFFREEIRHSQDVIFQWKDKKPFFFQILSLFEITFVKFRKNVSWLEATTGDIEWNGEHQ
ncbi:MAG: ATP-grasp domain-containing protein [Bacteroidia bacterium]